jgi:hypothetical protein
MLSGLESKAPLIYTALLELVCHQMVVFIILKVLQAEMTASVV